MGAGAAQAATAFLPHASLPRCRGRGLRRSYPESAMLCRTAARV
ncbi:hypothetical protein GLA29479_4744 [Lysobacter antibioticus]|nr:hypothetical protein GLA29479_4744 [Lysobacter antibioticus]